jgi:hypothetical protein
MPRCIDWWRVRALTKVRPDSAGESVFSIATEPSLGLILDQQERAMAKRKKSAFERLNSSQMNRKQPRNLGRRLAGDDPGLAFRGRASGP